MSREPRSCTMRTPMRPPDPPSVPSSPPLVSSSAVAWASSASTPQAASAAGSATRTGHGSRAGASSVAPRAPSTRESTASAEAPSASSRSGVPALIRSPTGVRMPVETMSRRPRTGAVQALVQPGSRADLSSSATSSALFTGRSSGQIRPSTRRSAGGAQAENQRCSAVRGHPVRGRSRTVVSAMVSGAGSVAVSARPIFPKTVATAGEPASAESWKRSCSGSSSSGAPGKVLGMKRRSPSSMRGRNSRPSPGSSGRQERSAAPAMASVQPGRESATCTKGR